MQSTQTRTPEAYEELLGFLLREPDVIPEVRFSLTPHMFKSYADLYELMTSLEKVPNYLILKRQHPDWSAIITELVQATSYITEEYLPHLITTVKNNTLREEIKRICYDTMRDADHISGDDLLRSIQQKTINLETSEINAMQEPEKDVDAYFENLDKIIADPDSALGMLTDIKEIDDMTHGWQRTDFSVVGARTSMGKSAYAIDNVLRLNAKGYLCAIFSLEMSKKQIYDRMCANLTGLPLEMIRKGNLTQESRNRIRGLRDKLSHIYVDDSRGISSDYIVDSMRKIKRKRGLDFVLVDYIQDIKEPNEANDNGGSAMARICRKLRKGAKEMDCHVQGLSQIDRRVETSKGKDTDKRPRNSDLTGSAGIESCADVIALLYRDDYYNAETSKKNIMEVIFSKQRNGKTGTVELAFLKSSQRLMELR